MEKSIIFASFLLFLSITTTFPKNCIYDTQISNRKLTCKTLQTSAGTFSTRAPPSFAKNSHPPQQFFDWFCRHKYKSKKLYSHIILFSPTISINLKYSLKSMPHSPANRAKRQRLSHQVNQVISPTDLPNLYSTKPINSPTTATNANNLIPTIGQVNQADLRGSFNSTSPTNSPTLTTTTNSNKHCMYQQVNQVNSQTDSVNPTNSTN